MLASTTDDTAPLPRLVTLMTLAMVMEEAMVKAIGTEISISTAALMAMMIVTVKPLTATDSLHHAPLCRHEAPTVLLVCACILSRRYNLQSCPVMYVSP